jgi:hypothetical protein
VGVSVEPNRQCRWFRWFFSVRTHGVLTTFPHQSDQYGAPSHVMHDPAGLGRMWTIRRSQNIGGSLRNSNGVDDLRGPPHSPAKSLRGRSADRELRAKGSREAHSFPLPSIQARIEPKRESGVADAQKGMIPSR